MQAIETARGNSPPRTFAMSGKTKAAMPPHMPNQIAPVAWIACAVEWADKSPDDTLTVPKAIEAEPQTAVYIGMIRGTLAFALIENNDVRAGLALIQEVLANEQPGPQTLALRLCVQAIGLALAGDPVRARSLIAQARKVDPRCQLLPAAARLVTSFPIVVGQELQALAPLVQRFGVSDDVERERVLNGASTEELIALVNAVTKEAFDQINQFLDQTSDAEDAVPFGDLAQAAAEARLELKLRGATDI